MRCIGISFGRYFWFFSFNWTCSECRITNRFRVKLELLREHLRFTDESVNSCERSLLSGVDWTGLDWSEDPNCGKVNTATIMEDWLCVRRMSRPWDGHWLCVLLGAAASINEAIASRSWWFASIKALLECVVSLSDRLLRAIVIGGLCDLELWNGMDGAAGRQW